MSEETVVAPDGRTEATFTRLPASERFVDFQHPLFSRIARPDGLTDAQIAAELGPFVDQLHRGLSALIGAIAQAEESTAELRPKFRAEKIATAASAPIEQLGKITSTRMAELEKAITAAEDRIAASVQRPQAADTVEGLLQAMRLDLQLSEIRGAVAEMSESNRLATAAHAAQDGNLALLWALDSAPVPMVKRESLKEIQKRVAIQRQPWREALLQYRREVHRAGLEMSAAARQFVTASLRRLENDHGIPADEAVAARSAAA